MLQFSASYGGGLTGPQMIKYTAAHLVGLIPGAGEGKAKADKIGHHDLEETPGCDEHDEA